MISSVFCVVHSVDWDGLVYMGQAFERSILLEHILNNALDGA